MIRSNKLVLKGQHLENDCKNAGIWKKLWEYDSLERKAKRRIIKL